MTVPDEIALIGVAVTFLGVVGAWIYTAWTGGIARSAKRQADAAEEHLAAVKQEIEILARSDRRAEREEQQRLLGEARSKLEECRPVVEEILGGGRFPEGPKLREFVARVDQVALVCRRDDAVRDDVARAWGPILVKVWGNKRFREHWPREVNVTPGTYRDFEWLVGECAQRAAE